MRGKRVLAQNLDVAALVAIVLLLLVCLTWAVPLFERPFVHEYPPRLSTGSGMIELGSDGNWHPVR